MLYDAESGDFTLVAGGDTMITRKLSVFQEEAFLGLKSLFQDADVRFTNLEMLMHEFEHSPGAAGGTFTGSDPKNLRELEWLGINLVSCANNHSYDYGEGGVLTNLRHLRGSKLVYSGTGRNLSEARAPGYLDTPQGRVGLVSASSTFSESGRALDQRPDIKGRPGLNPLRFSETHTVDRPAFNELHRISSGLGLEAQKDAQRRFRPKGMVPDDTDTEFRFMGKKFMLGEGFGITTRLNARDLEGNLKWVRDARRMSDWVVVSVHCHESADNRDRPPEFLVDFAKKCIDEGADVFIGHGPHVTRGIEIYKDKPIFYSLGNFIFQNDTVRWQPSFNYELMKLNTEATPADFYDARSELDSIGFPGDSIYWESVVIKCEFRKRRMHQITLHPIDLGYGKPRGQRGRPMLAGPDIAKKVLERMQRLSKPFGTAIKVEKGVGVLKL
ncbi:MAG: hypothetical protein BZY79_02715 [SAR202 cluster bacterium Casp-Chloro-G4]|nr:CapA family protein [Chloroflexota bacterium]PKB61645.1 MAG: hypothetical protein BZY79_02715 [SAR202 cluster bacterium Casp-Chloro-G4]